LREFKTEADPVILNLILVPAEPIRVGKEVAYGPDPPK
jgi:hypothetical protein